MSRVRRDEQGVALILALSFMVLIGLVTTALLSSLMGAVGSRSELDDVRNRQYAAEAAVERAIATVRTIGGQGPAREPCGPYDGSTLNGFTVHVDCTPTPTTTRGLLLQRNVVFTSCLGSSTCNATNTIVRAQVNYETPVDTTVTKTYIESWTVSR